MKYSHEMRQATLEFYAPRVDLYGKLIGYRVFFSPSLVKLGKGREDYEVYTYTDRSTFVVRLQVRKGLDVDFAIGTTIAFAIDAGFLDHTDEITKAALWKER